MYWKSMNKLQSVLFFINLGTAGVAQISGHEIKSTNKDVQISLAEIIGDWYTADSAAHKISFTFIINSLVDLKGITHGVGNYSFRVIGDSVFVNGTAPNWSPYDCTLRLLNNNRLEIEFYQFFSTETTKAVYRR